MKKRNRRRAIRNLIHAFLLLTAAWYCCGSPLPSLKMELHRAERQNLLPESRVVWTYNAKTYGDRDMIVGISTDTIHTYGESQGFFIWPRSKDTATLVLLPEAVRYNIKAHSLLDCAFLALDPPAEAHTARLTLTVGADFDTSIDYVMESTAENGLFFFQLERQYYAYGGGLDGMEGFEEQFLFDLRHPATVMNGTAAQQFQKQYPYTLEFFDAEGKLIETVTNSAQQS